MSIKTQIKKLEHYQVQRRSAYTRYGALVLTAATLFSLTELGHTHATSQAKRDVVTQMRTSLASAAENETIRMPIKFDDGLQATATTGE